MLHAFPVTPTLAEPVIGEPTFSVQLTLAVLAAGLVAVNGLPAVAVTVTEPLAPAATEPMVQFTVPLEFEHAVPPLQLT